MPGNRGTYLVVHHAKKAEAPANPVDCMVRLQDGSSVAAPESLVSATTDELAEKLPNNLHLARNDNAPEHDRWRIYNTATEKYCDPGAPTVRDLLINTLTKLNETCRAWTGEPRF